MSKREKERGKKQIEKKWEFFFFLFFNYKANVEKEEYTKNKK